MVASAGATVEPFFLESPGGPLFAVHHRPADAHACLGNVLVCMPFNEEMNRCRSMVTLLARALVAQGFGLLVVDLLGTGDSAGDYSDGRWSTWIDNLALAQQWLDRRPGGCSALLGIRLGALLATTLHARQADHRVALALWQPVLDGKTHLTQFMRVRIAANMDRADLPKETTATMRQQWAAGQCVEVAGYALHPELAAAVERATLADLALADGTPLLWLEHVLETGAAVSPASLRLLERWPGPAAITDLHTFTGPLFWQVFDRVLLPEVVDVTCRWLVTRSQPA